MSTWQRTIIRCEVFPAKFGSADITNLATGGAPKIAKGAGVEFRICLFDSEAASRTLLDISNVTYVGLRIFTSTAGGALLIDSDSVGAVVTITPNITLADWDAGTAQHISIWFPSSLTNVAAGTHFLTLHGITAEAAAEHDVFGKCNIEIIDVGNLGVATSPPPSGEPATMEQVTALISQLLGDYVRREGQPGETITLKGPVGDGTIIVLSASGGLIHYDLQQ